MTFNDIILHMFKANARRYVLYFLCNSFTVMLLFAYSTLMTNKDFMDYSKVSSAVFIGVCRYTFLYIIWCHTAF